MKHLVVLLTVSLCTLNGKAQDANRPWTLVLSPIAIEQQEGVVIKGPVRAIPLSSVILEASLAPRHFIRGQVRRVDWTMRIRTPPAGEDSEEQGFDVRMGYGYRMSQGQKVGVIAGADLSYRRTEIEGMFYEMASDEPVTLNHLKQQYSIAPFVGLDYAFLPFMSLRFEMGFNLGITDLDDRTAQSFPPNDVYTGGTVVPISVLGIAVRW